MSTQLKGNPGGGIAGSESGDLRGLIVNCKFAHRFVSEGKTWELKTSQCRCVSPGQLLYLVESGIGHNSKGLSVMRIIGRMRLVDTHKVTWYQLETPDSKKKHCCTSTELSQLKKQWQNKSNIYAWEVVMETVFGKPWYIRSGTQDFELECGCLVEVLQC